MKTSVLILLIISMLIFLGVMAHNIGNELGRAYYRAEPAKSTWIINAADPSADIVFTVRTAGHMAYNSVATIKKCVEIDQADMSVITEVPCDEIRLLGPDGKMHIYKLEDTP